MVLLNELYIVLTVLVSFSAMVVVHLFQYRVFMGGFLMTGGINEVWSLFYLLIVFKLYRQT